VFKIVDGAFGWLRLSLLDAEILFNCIYTQYTIHYSTDVARECCTLIAECFTNHFLAEGPELISILLPSRPWALFLGRYRFTEL
jgi:hypothetical protein